ncbi:hypothetical protein RB601_002138 [Gaeumannomyces tritici]
MSSQVIDSPNPAPLASLLPDHVMDLGVSLEKIKLSSEDLAGVKEFQSAACYIAAAMIFLRDNVFLKSELKFEHIKPRLLGHWGTCPGLILIWSHLNIVIRDHDLDMIQVIGPGHGAPAALAALWLEGSLEKFYPNEYTRDSKGLRNLITKFSVPGGFPSHINAETPGAIHEGGELGYALSVSFGAVMDKPDLIVACVVGDGEAETGPTATAWHSIKYLDPAESGAVIPILHVNGFKISERTIFGCMDDKEIICLFTGYGYQVRIVSDLNSINNDLHTAMEWCVSEIRGIQSQARRGAGSVKPRWPMIVLRTPKGWSGPKEVDGKFVEGSFHSHQVPLPKANYDEIHLDKLDDWLSSYKFDKMVVNGRPSEKILHTLPKNAAKRLGQIPLANCPETHLKHVDWRPFAVECGSTESSMQVSGKFLDVLLQSNPSQMRIFSPDELESNKLNAVLDHTQRNFQWDEFSRAQGGRVIETLSEHQCQGFMQGYTLTGGVAIFPSYESFLGIVHTMMVQYSKFTKIGRNVSWRGDLPSINYIETSTWTRQEHNGFSHQNPSFIGAVLNLKPEAARVYLPPDANCFLSTLHHCVNSKNYVNLMVGSKQPTHVYLTPNEAEEHCRNGAGVWHFASSQRGLGLDCHPRTESTPDPDVVLCGIGTEVTLEVVKAAELLGQVCPDLAVRVVNVTDLMVLSAPGSHPHALSEEAFAGLFTHDRPVFFNYHGYATELQGLLFGRQSAYRLDVQGYQEEGTTTTPFDMMLANGVSRFDLAAKALHAAARHSPAVSAALQQALGEVQHRAEGVKDHIRVHGQGMCHACRVPGLHLLTADVRAMHYHRP